MTVISNLNDIVHEIVLPNTKIAIGGAAMFLKPMEAVREIIRQQIKDLEIITLIGDLDIDLLCGVKAISVLQSSYGCLNFRLTIRSNDNVI